MKTPELYVLTITETGEILTPKTFKQHWPNYGSNGLSGWRPPKKIYYTVGSAKSGFAHIPEDIKPRVSISVFTNSGAVPISGESLAAEQRSRRGVRQRRREERDAEIARIREESAAAIERARRGRR